jgi:Na+-driven multidrug efflux pump
MITIYKSDFVCNPGNCVFPHEVKITDIASAIEAFSKDYTCALFKNNYRSIENFIFTALGATTVTASTFTAQNIGAKCYRRARKAFWDICLISSVIAVLMSVGGMLLRDPLLSLYGVENTEDLLATLSYDASVKRMIWKWPAFFIYAIMNACGGTIRGLGRSSTSAVITFFGTCVFRIAWIYTAFRYFRNLESIYISYPISWFLTGVFFLGVVFFLFSKYRNLPEEAPDPE